jgi:predicted flap endonuclease-1-like 5' DNA nuclease
MVDPTIVVGGAVTLVSLAATAYLVFRRSGGNVENVQLTDDTSGEVEEAVEAGEDFVVSASETIEEGVEFANEVEDVVDDVTGKNDLTNVKGVGPTRAASFREEGFENPDDLYYATDENLAAVKGIGDLTVSQIREDIGSVDNDGSDGSE